ncbi:MAG: hypothetical protein HY875_08015 [Chloroflexi bacterium]|nr:hypothetical protein [Chloroflexota bacterium]
MDIPNVEERLGQHPADPQGFGLKLLILLESADARAGSPQLWAATYRELAAATANTSLATPGRSIKQAIDRLSKAETVTRRFEPGVGVTLELPPRPSGPPAKRLHIPTALWREGWFPVLDRDALRLLLHLPLSPRQGPLLVREDEFVGTEKGWQGLAAVGLVSRVRNGRKRMALWNPQGLRTAPPARSRQTPSPVGATVSPDTLAFDMFGWLRRGIDSRRLAFGPAVLVTDLSGGCRQGMEAVEAWRRKLPQMPPASSAGGSQGRLLAPGVVLATGSLARSLDDMPTGVTAVLVEAGGGKWQVTSLVHHFLTWPARPPARQTQQPTPQESLNPAQWAALLGALENAQNSAGDVAVVAFLRAIRDSLTSVAQGGSATGN